MQKYSKDILGSLNGVTIPLVSASCSVFNAGTTVLATIYSGNGVTPLANPFTTSSVGNASFYATSGRYDVVVSKAGYVSFTDSDVIISDTFSDKINFTATNPAAVWTDTQNNYIQLALQNLSAGTSASSDVITYANNGNDLHGYADLGMTSSGYADAVYTVTGPNEAYLFGGAPAGSGKTGNFVFATDSTGTANAFQWYPGGFTQAKTAYKMQLDRLGNFYLKPPTAVPALTVNGDMVFNLTTNTNLRISVHGLDGVTRVANIALA